MTVFYLVVFAASVLLSFVLTRYVRALATARGWVEVPVSDRHLHVRPLPRLGGVAIFGSFVLTLGLAIMLGHWYHPSDLVITYRGVLSILLPGTLIFLLGVYDDVRPLGPYVKFAVEAVAAAILFAFGLRVFRQLSLDRSLALGYHQRV